MLQLVNKYKLPKDLGNIVRDKVFRLKQAQPPENGAELRLDKKNFIHRVRMNTFSTRSVAFRPPQYVTSVQNQKRINLPYERPTLCWPLENLRVFSRQAQNLHEKVA